MYTTKNCIKISSQNSYCANKQHILSENAMKKNLYQEKI